MKVEVGLVTVDRKDGYIHRTMDSLAESGFFESPGYPEVTLYVGQPDADYLSRYKDWPKVKIDVPSYQELELSKYAEMHTKARCGYGHWRALTGLAKQELDAAVVLEDDVIFSKGWWQFALRQLEDVEIASRGIFILQLYRLVHDVRTQHMMGRRWYWIQNWTCFGTQANAYSKKILQGLADFVWKSVVTDYQCPIDAAVIWHSKLEQILTYASAPSVVQHVGRLSTGQTDYFHESECFLEIVTGLL